jgi:peptide/nickel transport system ATP-binding protein/oligopeptide transport system ATP-binding protein
MSENKELLEVKNLGITFFTDKGALPAVQEVSFKISQGETLGVVGESGCGKSMTALSLMQLIPSPPGKITAGEIIYKGEDLLKKSTDEIQGIRGKEISMIFQEPMTSLNPVITVGKQIMEAILIHENVSKKEAADRALEMIKLVGIPMPEKVFASYPHELSGGMRQRIMIAMALSCQPSLLICDEPTTALDVTIQAQILKLINKMKYEMNSSVLLITHDMGVISEMADNVIVMYAGKIVEYTNVEDLFKNPLHPYTVGLMSSIPDIDAEDEGELNVIPGSVPMLNELPEGCFFAPRCKYAKPICHKKCPSMINMGEKHQVRCFKYSDEMKEDE